MGRLIIFTIFLIIGVVNSFDLVFNKHQIYQVQIENDEQLKVLQDSEEFTRGFELWRTAAKVGQQIDLFVPPYSQGYFGELVEKLNLNYSIKIDNIQKLIDNERPSKENRATYQWDDYYTLDEVNNWLDEIIEKYRNELSLIEAGYTFETRRIRGVKLARKRRNPVIIIEANIYARDWITTATATWILNELVSSTDPEIQHLADNYNWYIFPILNPDGYHYTMIRNRFWKKTRGRNGWICFGKDINSVWDVNWEPGTGNGCLPNYPSGSTFSVVEAYTFVRFLESTIQDEEVRLFISFHSYGGSILFPWGPTGLAPVNNYNDLLEIGQAAADKLKSRQGTEYEVANAGEIIYNATGTMSDWVYDKKVPLVYRYEFSDKGQYGFLLPADQIVPTSQEILDSLIGLVAKAEELKYMIIDE